MKTNRISVFLASNLVLASLTGVAAPVPTQQAYLKASNTERIDWFGSSVAVSADTVVIGAPQEDSDALGVNGDQYNNRSTNSGAVYILVRNGTKWDHQAFLKASNTSADDRFGHSVAVSGDTVVVGAFSESSQATGVNGDQGNQNATDSGAVYVFVRSGTNWSQQGYLKAFNTMPRDHFGAAVAISGDTIVVGAPYEDSNATGVNGNGVYTGSYSDRGAAYVFVRNGSNWSQQAYLKGSNTDPFDNFGGAVAISGNTIVVGASGEDSNATGVNGGQTNNAVVQSGAAYVFMRSGTNWIQQAYLKSLATQVEGLFGQAVAASDDTVVIGALGEDSGAGGAYVFVRNGTNWSSQGSLRASNREARDQFGWSVALSGETVAIGAPFEDSNATGVNGNETNNSGYESGAGYVFVREGTHWRQQAYLKASNTGGAPLPNETGDYFGMAMAISGDTVVAGSVVEASNATGVNGDQANNLAGGAGAAYVFSGLGVGPRLELALDGADGRVIRFTGASDVRYRLQRAASTLGPWDTIASFTAPVSGQIEYRDASPPSGPMFYRVVQP